MSSTVRRTQLHLEEALRLSPGRPALASGFRAALTLLLPFAIGAAFHSPPAARWAGTTGFMVAMADKGGAYRTRAEATGSVAIFGVLAVLLGSLAGATLWSAIAGMFLCAALGGLVGLFGPQAVIAGRSVAVLFAIAIAYPSTDPHHVLERSLFALGGGAWAIFLAIVLWPIRRYAPARQAVAACFAALSDQTERLQTAWNSGATSLPPEVAQAHANLRSTIEEARTVLAATRRGGHAESGRGAHLLVLLQAVESVFSALISLEQELNDIGASKPAPALRNTIGQSLAIPIEPLDQIALRVLNDQLPPWQPVPPIDSLGNTPHLAHVSVLLERIRQAIEASAHITSSLPGDRTVAPQPEEAQPSWSALLHDNLSFDSLYVRHALRIGLISAIAVGVASRFHLGRGYWVTLTVLLLLQPTSPATVVKGLQRIIGTVLGGIVAALIATAVHSTLALIPIVLVLAAVGASLVQINYALYAFFATPTFVLLVEMYGGDWTLAKVRIVNTLIGGALAFAGTTLLWPERERDRLPDLIGTALAAVREYMTTVISVVVSGEPLPSTRLAAARRRLGLAINAAEASFQRLLAETRDSSAVEPLMAMLLYIRRLGAACGALASARTIVPMQGSELIASFSKQATEILNDLESSARRGVSPAELPPFRAPETTEPLLRARLDGIERQLFVLQAAAARWLR